MGKENVHLQNGVHSTVENNEIKKFSGKWIELGKKKHPECGNQSKNYKYGTYLLICGY